MAENTPKLSLKSLLVPSKEIELEYPGMPGFKINLSFLSRETLVAIRKKATTVKYKNRLPVEETNDILFLKLYVDAAIKGWTGLKLSYLELLLPVDLTGQNPEAEIEYDPETALDLMKGSSQFDAFVSETVNELGNFKINSTN